MPRRFTARGKPHLRLERLERIQRVFEFVWRWDANSHTDMQHRELRIESLRWLRHGYPGLYGWNRQLRLGGFRRLRLVFEFVRQWLQNPHAGMQLEQPGGKLPGLRVR